MILEAPSRLVRAIGRRRLSVRSWSAGMPVAPAWCLRFAEPRAWKGRSGFGAATLEALTDRAADADLIVLFGHPRLLMELPGDAPVLLAWHRQQLMQEAVARWIRGKLR